MAVKQAGRINADLVDRLDQMAREESASKGRFVARTELIERAVKVELAKHRRRARAAEREQSQ